ncbi:phosphate signaling complex protein PhoU [Desulforhopalus singaporensis]|uniref:Phosphate-specific transport system accessory protein PhoU n=1 Tax=Desulforhopalus singaporensis TaxID=91360 RepID=A0A1H0N3A5_9BACT|nr:phosphate signaling complex protein PhoU [Desulforhopalus singaporensis]SDO87143.1 phosphate transport system protein [Desulforhopalus singaporensis]
MKHHFTFHNELEKLNKKILRLSTMVEERVRSAAMVIDTRDQDMVHKIIVTDYEIDEMEIEIEEDCLKILALHQPVATDLRFLVAVIKINNEMERIADMAVSIAMRVDNISKFNHQQAVSYNFAPMIEKVLKMLKNSIDALVNHDATLAKSIFIDDDFVDHERNKCYEETKKRIMSDCNHPGFHINTYLLARHLERIADRAVNIAEEVIYFVEGNITRFH